jgi:hypothetical protein
MATLDLPPIASLAAAIAMATLVNDAAFAQSEPTATTAPATEPAAIGDSHQGDPLAIFRAPLLREGSMLVEAKATLQREGAAAAWLLILADAAPGEPQRDLALLPCTTLSEMRRFVDAAPNQNVVFLVTGQVFVFRGRNYVLPTRAPVLTQEETAASSLAPPPATKPSDNPAGDDSAQDIARNLTKATGPLIRNPAPSTNPPSTKPSSGRSATAGVTDSVMRENTAIVERRGKLKRDTGGGWLFVFDADASGLADPPMKLLPCLLLERIEDYGRKQGNNSPAQLSGQVYLYDGRNYLLPTVFRIPRDRRNLTP